MTTKGCGSFFIPFRTMMNKKKDFFDQIRNGNAKAIEEALQPNPELLESTDERGSTPLLLSTYYGHENVAVLLLQKGAKIDMKDSSGNTALMGVCFKGYIGIAKLLIDAGANVNHVNAMGATCLIYAATFNRLEMAQLLLEHGADSSAKDARGNTALDQAKMQDFKE